MKKLTIVFIFIGLIDLYSGQRSFNIGSNSGQLSPECWKQRNGDYVLEGHGKTNECYATLEEAKAKCLAAGDCRAIATQNNVCGGKFRVAHGGPTFIAFANWQPYAMRAYEYICGRGTSVKVLPELGKSCTSEGLDQITTETDCKAAAKELNLTWGNSWNGPNEMPGCIFAEDSRKKVYFNTSPKPGFHNAYNEAHYAEICKVSSYEKIQGGTLCSDMGLKEIKSEDNCKAAAAKLHLTWAHSWNGQNEIPGCIFANDARKKVFYNKSPNPSRSATNLNPNYESICEGSIGIPIHVAKRGAECKSADENLGNQVSLEDCAKACKEKTGCKYFVYGYGGKAKRCYWEKTKTADCPEGWERDDYNFYEMKRENKGEYVLGPKGSGSCSEGTQIMDEATCREACRVLNLPLAEILGNQKCYKDHEGKCYQNGRQGSGASLICKKSGQTPANSGKPGCTCKDLINSHGQGNCQGSRSNVLGKQICYVNQPSTCTDARASLGSLPGEKFSAQACEFDDEFTKDGYLVENGKHCEGNLNERMLNETNVIDARLWCTKNPSCVEIYSVCGRRDTFAYCKKNDNILPSSCGSKMFTKAKWACPYYDVGFILDGSGSVTKTNWLKELKFTQEVAKLAEISKDGSRAGVISFASTPVLKIKFTDHDNYASFSNAVGRLPFTAGGTNIIKALQDGLDEMFVPRIGQQVDNIRLAFLITDGKDNNAMQKYMDMKKNYEKHHIALFVIAVGDAQHVDEPKLKVLDPNFLQVSDFDKLKEVFHTRVGHNMCKPSNFTVPSCSTLKVTNADNNDSNGQYEYLPAVRSPWAPDRPVYKRVNITGGSSVRYIFMNEGKGLGWVIGGPTELMRTNSFFHQSGHKAKEPWKGGPWRNNEIVTCDNGLCCQAQVATCLACKANQTIEDYCRLNPLTTGCPRETCAKIQCANGGTCVEIGRGTKCNCPAGFVGVHCDTKDLCHGYQCANGGQCSVTNGMPQCRCPLGYLGSHCEKKDRCYDYQCLNGGQCVENNGLPECRCSRQYHGCHCEQKDPCVDFQCSNGGTCTENNGIPKCSCPSGFSGTHCGEKDPCYNYKCANGGTCVADNNDRPICNCLSGFSGNHCEKRAACASYQCANGGSCVETNGTATCNCPKGFSGEHCGEKDALEGQRCGGRSGRPCAEGLQCIGKIQKTGGQGTCRKSGNNCPNGVPVVKCVIDPCQLKTCSDQKATCVSNYCGGCNAVFYNYDGQSKAKCLPNLFGCKGNRIALMDPHKKFLQILPSGEGIATSKIMTNLKGSTITFEDLGGDNFDSTLQSYTDRKVALKSEYGKYLVAYPGPNFDIRADGTSPARGGTFVLRHNDHTPKQYWFRTMYTKTENGRERPLYMWDTKGKLRGNADDVRRWEKFIPTCLDDEISNVGQSYDNMGMQSSSYGYSGNMPLEGGAGGLRGGYGSEFGSGIQGGFMDAPGCETLPMYECSDAKTRLRCPTRCSQRLRSDNEIVNLRGCKQVGQLCRIQGGPQKYQDIVLGDCCSGLECHEVRAGVGKCRVKDGAWKQCMSKSCGSCEIKGREKYIGHHSLDQCKAECLKNDQCKGIDYGILPPNHMECYLALEDERLVGTTFRLTFEAFRKHPCLGSEVPTGYTQMWSPNAETVLRYKSNDLTSSFQDAQQLNGFNNPNSVHMVADVKVQAFNDETLRVKLEHMRFYGRNGEVSMIEAHEILDPISSGNGHDMHGAQDFKTFLEDPMLILVKKGRAKNLLVSKNEPDCITKIKQELANGLLQNGQSQSLQVVKKTGIIKPMRMSTNVKKIDLI